MINYIFLKSRRKGIGVTNCLYEFTFFMRAKEYSKVTEEVVNQFLEENKNYEDFREYLNQLIVVK